MSGGDNGDAMLAAMIARLESAGDELPDVLPKLGAAVKRALVEANQAGVTPDGAPYVRTQDGHVPLRQGAKAIRVAVNADGIRAQVGGAEGWHATGRARGRIERPMLPGAAVPPAMLAELHKVLDKFVLDILTEVDA